jgi:hypothetical protein
MDETTVLVVMWLVTIAGWFLAIYFASELPEEIAEKALGIPTLIVFLTLVVPATISYGGLNFGVILLATFGTLVAAALPAAITTGATLLVRKLRGMPCE